MREQWVAHLAQPLCVVIVGLGTQVHLEVAEHVDEDEAEERYTAHGHDRLLADLGSKEIKKP